VWLLLFLLKKIKIKKMYRDNKIIFEDGEEIILPQMDIWFNNFALSLFKKVSLGKSNNINIFIFKTHSQ
jgi:hypothetical protein